MSGFSYGVRSIWKRPDVIEALRDALGRKLTAGAAAKELSEKFGVTITRNAVIGKAARSGIAIQGVIRNAGWFKPSDKPNAPPPAETAIPLPPEPIAIPVSRRVQLLELTFRSCRWPLGDPRDDDFTFCGADRVKPHDAYNAYCAAHAAVAYYRTSRSAQNIAADAKRRAAAIKRKATEWAK